MLQTLVSNEKYFMLWTLSVNVDKIFFGMGKIVHLKFYIHMFIFGNVQKKYFLLLEWWRNYLSHICVRNFQAPGPVQGPGQWVILCLCVRMDIGGCRVTFATENETKSLWCECSHGIISGEPRKPCCESTAHYGSSYLVQWSK